jgi:hypothetical protein
LALNSRGVLKFLELLKNCKYKTHFDDLYLMVGSKDGILRESENIHKIT